MTKERAFDIIKKHAAFLSFSGPKIQETPGYTVEELGTALSIAQGWYKSHLALSGLKSSLRAIMEGGLD
jgi:hypothetical protein